MQFETRLVLKDRLIFDVGKLSPQPGCILERTFGSIDIGRVCLDEEWKFIKIQIYQIISRFFNACTRLDYLEW